VKPKPSGDEPRQGVVLVTILGALPRQIDNGR
jgi:hypothetical protein